MRVQSHLFLLALGAIAPLVAVLLAGGIVLWKAERESLEREAIGRTRAAMSAVDSELRGSIITLKALAASKNLEIGDIRSFYEEARRVLAAQPQWRNIGLATRERQQLIDAIRPYGEHAAFGSDEAFDEVIRTRAPAVSSLSAGKAITELSVRVRVPVIIGGELRYVLSAPIAPESFSRILHAQRLPEGWTIGLADRNQRFIARIPYVAPGNAVSSSFKAALDDAPSGWFRGRTLEGVDTFTPYVTSEASGWVLGIAMPANVVQSGGWRAVWVGSIGGFLALTSALALAWLIAQRIAKPIVALADAAETGLAGVMPGIQRIEEIERLHNALRKAAREVSERQSRLEAEQTALLRQSGLLQQRTAEAETLMQVIPIAVFKAEDAHCRTITANPAAYRFVNLPLPPSVSTAMHWPPGMRVLREGRDLSNSELPLQRSIASCQEQAGEELEFRFGDGSLKFGFAYAAPLVAADGSPRGAVCAIVDVTERREDERRKDEFLAILAHELRNPLAPMMNALQLLQSAPDDPEINAQSREILDRQVRQMKRLIDDLMDVSRITQGKLELRRETVELKAVVDEAIDACRPMLDELGHHLEIELPAEPVLLDGDPTRLTQMLSNLLGNACKFTPRLGRIRLAASRNADTLSVSVRDNGIGMSAGLLGRVFDLFVQGDASLERSTGGLGIGLSLVQRLARMHGGTVEARSEGPGKGAEFIVRLPIVVAATPQTLEHRPTTPLNAPLRILVVDDSRDAADTLAMLLELSGHVTEIANDGLQALQAVEDFCPEVVFMDIGMPGLNGFDAARRMRELPQGKNLMLVAITGWGQEADRLKSKAAGFDAHLVKPVEFMALEHVLARMPKRRESAPQRT
jgi:signal transduction histidine kinase/ActR/RegA family two-component response regulator